MSKLSSCAHIGIRTLLKLLCEKDDLPKKDIILCTQYLVCTIYYDVETSYNLVGTI